MRPGFQRFSWETVDVLTTEPRTFCQKNVPLASHVHAQPLGLEGASEGLMSI